MDYHKTPDNFPITRMITNKNTCKTDDIYAYPCYDKDALYLPYVISSSNANHLYYLKIDKQCIMDAIEYWKSIDNESDSNNDDYDCSDDLIKKDLNISFDNMIIKGINALKNREYKEEKEISNDE